MRGLTRRALVQASVAGAAVAATSGAVTSAAATSTAAPAPAAFRLLTDDLLNFQAMFTLSAADYGAADLGEVIATVEVIKAAGESRQTFADAYIARARMVAARADDARRAGHRASARSAYLRAATYYGSALFFVLGTSRPADEASLYAAMQRAWHAATRLFDHPCERVLIPYEGSFLPGYFLRPEGPHRPRPTVILNNGSDATNVDLYVYGGAAAVERGYNALILEGPGQGSMLYDRKIPFRPDWEKVITPVVDWLCRRPEVDDRKIALTGWSLCGEMVVRAAAYEHRLAAVCSDPGLVDAWAKDWKTLDGLLAIGDKDQVNKVWQEQVVPTLDPETRFTLAKRGEIFGSQFLDDARAGNPPVDIWTMAESVKKFNCTKDAPKVRSPFLVIGYDAEQFFAGQDKILFDLLKAPKDHIVLTTADGAGEHDAPLAARHRNEVVFDWLDDTL